MYKYIRLKWMIIIIIPTPNASFPLICSFQLTGASLALSVCLSVSLSIPLSLSLFFSHSCCMSAYRRRQRRCRCRRRRSYYCCKQPPQLVHFCSRCQFHSARKAPPLLNETSRLARRIALTSALAAASSLCCLLILCARYSRRTRPRTPP